MGDHNVCPSCGGDTMAPARKGCDTPDWSHVNPDFDGIDLLAPEETGPDPFPVHEIRVTKIAYDDPAWEFGIDPSECEYEIDHGRCDLRGEECLVESHVREMGLHQSLFGTWDKGDDGNRIQEKTYRVRGWVAHYPATPNGPEEYDAGVEPVEEDDDEV